MRHSFLKATEPENGSWDSNQALFLPRAIALLRKDLLVCSFLSSQFLLILHSSLLFPFKEKDSNDDKCTLVCTGIRTTGWLS